MAIQGQELLIPLVKSITRTSQCFLTSTCFLPFIFCSSDLIFLRLSGQWFPEGVAIIFDLLLHFVVSHYKIITQNNHCCKEWRKMWVPGDTVNTMQGQIVYQRNKNFCCKEKIYNPKEDIVLSFEAMTLFQNLNGFPN